MGSKQPNKMTDEQKAELFCREYWTETEFSYLLAGRGIDVSQPREDSSNKALGEIQAAISAMTLVVIPDSGVGAALYGLRRIKPSVAIMWVKSKPPAWRFHKSFPDFGQLLETTSNLMNGQPGAIKIQEKRELVLKGWLIGRGIAVQEIELTQKKLWNELGNADKLIFPPSGDETIKEFFKKQSLCTFKKGRRNGG